MRVRIAHETDNAPVIRLCFDSGKGFNADEILQLNAVDDGEYQGITFLRTPVRRVRIALNENSGKFTIDELGLYNVPRVFVRRLGIEALSAYHPDFRGTLIPKIRSKLVAQCRISEKCFDDILEEEIRSLIEPMDRVDYETWMREVEQPYMLEQLRRWQGNGGRSRYEPLISVLLPVFDPPEKLLRQCLDSVLTQTYPNWELCIADDASSMPHVLHILKEYEHSDPRIGVNYRISNGGISAATNTALGMAKGDYIALMDHDDTLAPNALMSVTEALNRTPRPKILYSDEDKIDADGKRFDPHFKSDWNPDLLYSQNYVSHLGIYETELVRSIGGFRSGYEGSQDHDLVLRAGARVDESQIHHIPFVLYHWRATEGSAASGAEDKLYAWDAGMRALRSFFDAQGNNVRIDRGPTAYTYRCRWPLLDPQPFVSIIIPTRDNVELLKACISSVLEKTRYSSFEIIVVDNDSRKRQTLNYLSRIASDKRVDILEYPGSFNFSAINNYAVSKSRGKILCLLNDDIEVVELDWLTEMVSHACRPDIGCVGAKLVYPNGRIQHGGVICGIGGVAAHSHKYFSQDETGYFSRLVLTQNFSAVTAACLVVRRNVWNAAGGMNADDLPVTFNDVDFCLRVRHIGLRNVWTPYALLRHHESATRGAKLKRDDRQRYLNEVRYMQAKWKEYLKRDPYYSPHLTMRYEDFSIGISRRLN